jgi:enamine deaminase RidA (YjgF/YER057c/UK114 family)
MVTVKEAALEAGVQLPSAPEPAARYAPYISYGDLLFLSGIVPLGPAGLLYEGQIGTDGLSIEAAKQCAEQCALLLLAQLAVAEELETATVDRVLRLTGYVSSKANFTQQHIVVDSASTLLERVLGGRGRHTRESVGVIALPLNAPVELSAWAAITKAL